MEDGGGAAKMEQFLILVKNAKGRAAAQIIAEATATPGLFAFGELLDMPNIKELATSKEHGMFYELLRLFACGTWPEYRKRQGELPALSAAQVLKLKQLTVATMAASRKVLPYAALLEALEMPAGGVRALEDLLINDCMYAGLIKGKLDQRGARLEVHAVMGRDLGPADLATCIQGLNTWLAGAEEVLGAIEARVSGANAAAVAAAKHKAAVDAAVEDAREHIKADVDLKGAAAAGMGEEFGGLLGLHHAGTAGHAAAMDMEDENRGRPKRYRGARHS